MDYTIIVFKNTNDAMAGERRLKELNYDFRIMPTPTSITQSCGICIRIEDDNIIKKILDSKEIEFKAIYKRSIEGYNLVS